ncbi:MAG: thiamine phosphate synthase [Ruminococcus sp.]|nr:thiamine phosphate synthase [Ruminococcus sp.]
MRFENKQLALYAVTDRGCIGERGLAAAVEQAIKGGATMIQLREKGKTREELVREARELKALCSRYSVPLIVNDDYEAAIEAGADGVHVGAEDAPVSLIRQRAGKGFIIGATAKTPEQALAAEKAGADYLGVGAVFPSPTKKNALRITPEQLKEITASVSVPCVAIGGLKADNLSVLSGSGAAGAAVVSAVFGQEDITSAAERLRQIVREVLGV